jgi:hypothetical protein
MVALPVELLRIVFSSLLQRNDVLACILVCKEWNTVAMIRLYERGLRLEALPTLWTRPGLAALVKHVQLIWDEDHHYEWRGDPKHAQLLESLEEEEVVRALREGSPPAHIVLLLKLLPSLQTLSITSFPESMMWDFIPAPSTRITSSSERMLHCLTSLEVKAHSQHGLTFGLLIRCMALPTLQSLTAWYVNGEKPLEPSLVQMAIKLYGTSSVEHLRLKDVCFSMFQGEGQGDATVFSHVLRISRRLRTFSYRDFHIAPPSLLGPISDALQHLRQSLEVLEVYHWMKSHSTETALDRLRDLHEFPLLTHLTTPAYYVTGPAVHLASTPPPLHLLPPSLTFWNVRIEGNSDLELHNSHLPFIHSLLYHHATQIKQIALMCPRNGNWNSDWVHSDLQTKCDDAGVSIMFDDSDDSDNLMPGFVIPKHPGPIPERYTERMLGSGLRLSLLE